MMDRDAALAAINRVVRQTERPAIPFVPLRWR